MELFTRVSSFLAITRNFHKKNGEKFITIQINRIMGKINRNIKRQMNRIMGKINRKY